MNKTTGYDLRRLQTNDGKKEIRHCLKLKYFLHSPPEAAVILEAGLTDQMFMIVCVYRSGPSAWRFPSHPGRCVLSRVRGYL